jgi:hypothetical protein
MNVFVLTTGRSGSLTFAEACRRITNYTTGHETRVGRVGPERLAYPDRHIEVDHRLAWFLGRMDGLATAPSTSTSGGTTKPQPPATSSAGTSRP